MSNNINTTYYVPTENHVPCWVLQGDELTNSHDWLKPEVQLSFVEPCDGLFKGSSIGMVNEDAGVDKRNPEVASHRVSALRQNPLSGHENIVKFIFQKTLEVKFLA